MPRDISGNYTLPVGNPVIAGTIIDVGWANPTMADFVVQFNNVITRDGVLGATNPIKFTDGSAAAPSIAFNSDPALGIYRASLNTLGFSTAGTARGSVNSTGNWSMIAANSGETLIIGGATPIGLSADGAELNWNSVGTNPKQINFFGACDFQIAGQTAGSSFSIYTGANVLRMTVGSAGNVTVAAPSSGTAVRVDGVAGQFNIDAQAAGEAIIRVVNAAQNVQTRVGASATESYIGGFTTQDFSVYSNSVKRTTWNSAGSITINAPSSGPTIKFDAATASWAETVLRASLEQKLYSILSGPTAGPGIRARWDSATSNRYIAIGSYDNSGVWSPTFTNTDTTTWAFQNSNVNINAPFSGTSLDITGLSGQRALKIVGTSSAAIFALVDGQSGTREWMISSGGNAAGVFTIRDSTIGTDRLGIETDGRLWGGALHNVGTVTGTTKQYIASGTYTPTLTNVSNVSSTSVAGAKWIRVGNMVHVTMQLTGTPTASSTTTRIRATVPIASNFTVAADLTGVCVGVSTQPGAGWVQADAANDAIDVQWRSTSTGAELVYVVCSYEVL